MHFPIPQQVPNWINQHDCKLHLLVPYRLWHFGIHPAVGRICCGIRVSNVGRRLLCRFPESSIPFISWPFSHLLLVSQYLWWCCSLGFSQQLRSNQCGMICVISSLLLLQGFWIADVLCLSASVTQANSLSVPITILFNQLTSRHRY